MDLLPGIPKHSIDLILTDPPYGMTELKWDSIIPLDLMWPQLERVVKPGAMICLFGQEPFSSRLRLSRAERWRYDWYWDKVRPMNFMKAKVSPLQRVELISCFSDFGCSNKKNHPHPPYYPQGTRSKIQAQNKLANKGNNRLATPSLSKNFNSTTTAYPHNIIRFSKPGNRSVHPTQKPVALLSYLIRTYTREGQTVLDFTMGSGSTGVAAKKTKRNFVGIEIDPSYFKIAKGRIGAAV